jgi:4-amino-4-deoxy-L-arabinose transferase-like glycosyltransferase
MRASLHVRRDVPVIIGLGILAALAHGVNVFDYPAPSLADDEGTYLQQAWSVLREGRLSPYTYTYDHVPGGWLQIAGWLGLVGPRAFGSIADTARVFILVLHVGAVVLLFIAARRMGAPRLGAGLAAGLFAASPLALFYGRLVVLENVMMFWLVASLALIVAVRAPYGVALGGVAFGIAILSKEPALVLLPAYALLVVSHVTTARLRHVALLIVPALAIASLYPAYALANGAFWPSGQIALRPVDPRAYGGASLLDSLIWQVSRPGGNPFDASSELRIAITDWLRRDALLVVGGVAASFRNLLRERRRSWTTPVGVLGLVAFGFLARGGIVYPFHVGLALPFLALNLGIASGDLLVRVRLPHAVAVRALAPLALAAFWIASGLPRLYFDHPGEASRAATRWIEDALPTDAVIVGGDDLWAELHEPDALGRGFPAYHSYWRLAYDANARRAALPSGWRSIRYVVVSVGLLDSVVRTTRDEALLDALRNARLVARWTTPTTDSGLHPKQVLELWRVDEAATTETGVCDDETSIVCAHLANARTSEVK